MSVSYADRSKARFTCDGARRQWGEPQCQALTARPLQELVTQQVLIALEPASLELSLQAADEVESERRRLERHHQQNLERASYEADRAWRQYTAVEPEHRLVARELELRWEEALRQQREAQESLDRFRQERPSRLSEPERGRIRDLAASVPALWHAPTTSASDRQAIVRQLIDRVAVRVIEHSERVEVVIHWAGGFESRHEVRRPVASYQRLQDGRRLLHTAVEWKRQGLTCAQIADRLNDEDCRGAQGRPFTPVMVNYLCRRARRQGLLMDPLPLPENHWRAGELSGRLRVPATTLNSWRRRGWIHARRSAGHWIYWANKAELKRLASLRDYPRKVLKRVPRRLTSPSRSPRWSGM